MTIPIPNPHIAVSMLAFFQGTQLNLFERFLTQAVAGIDSTSITSGMQNVAYVVLLVGFLWQVYQSALHGGDVRGLGTNLIKYIVTALVIMNYGTVFTTINQGFVNAGNWISNASGSAIFLKTGGTILELSSVRIGFQNLWGLITGSIAGVIDGILIHCRLHSLSRCHCRFRILLHLLRQRSLHLWSNRDRSHASRRSEPHRQVVHRKRPYLECLADPLRRIRRFAERSPDGSGRSDAQPK